MEAIPFWSHPEVAKAIALLCVSLAGLFAAARGAVWAWAVYQRRRAEQQERRGTHVTPREYRRSTDHRLMAVEQGLTRVTGELSSVSGKVSGLEADAAFLKGKVDQAGLELKELKEAQRDDREEMQEMRRELAEFTGKYETDIAWIKTTLMRLENRRG